MIQPAKQPIGVFDSGIGGLSILQALRAELPHDDFLYIADSGHAPYGERDTAHVLARSRAMTGYLLDQNIKALVVACNTATAAAVQMLRADHPDLVIVGTEPAIKPAVALSRTGHIGVLATRSTLASAKFQALLASHAGAATWTLLPGSGLADAIERSASNPDATELIAACARSTGDTDRFGLKNGQIDVLVLGCTHYPFAADVLRSLITPQVQLLDSGDAVARQTRRRLEAASGPASETSVARAAPSGQLRFFATGPTHSLDAAALRWLGIRAGSQSLSI